MKSTRIGTRELRAELATMVRRAAAGQRIVVTVGNKSAAVLGPVEDTGTDVSTDALVAAGLLLPPRRSDAYRPATPVAVWSGVRLDQAFREVRG